MVRIGMIVVIFVTINFKNQITIRSNYSFIYVVESNTTNIHLTKTNKDIELVSLNEGDLLIFPGEINHQTTPYNGKKERMVIGSSYFIQGQLGTDGNYDSINIGNNHARY